MPETGTFNTNVQNKCAMVREAWESLDLPLFLGCNLQIEILRCNQEREEQVHLVKNEQNFPQNPAQFNANATGVSNPSIHHQQGSSASFRFKRWQLLHPWSMLVR